jgi:hypothetical protein
MVVVRFSRRAELRALPILLRHSPGTILRGGFYIIRDDAARALRDAGVKFTLVTRVAGT